MCVYNCVAVVGCGCGCLDFDVCNYVFSFGTMCCSLTNYSTKYLTR